MPIKIVHTADNHIGMRFSHIPNIEAREKMVAERILALKRIVDFANINKADFLVVAGDLFDKLKTPSDDLKKTATILNNFVGEAVVIIPGNHDYFSASGDELWSNFSKHINEEKVFVLTDYRPKSFAVNDSEITFFPAGCRSPHSSENLIGWVKEYPKNTRALNIGIAHGNVEGLGLDDVHKYFNMTPAELKSSGLDFWLLGHIHVPFPTQSVASNPGYFFSATHTPDGFSKKHSGFFWLIEVDEKKNLQAILQNSDSFRFITLEKNLHSMEDFESLKSEIDCFNAPKTALKLVLNGRLEKEQIPECENHLEKISSAFLFFSKENNLTEKIDKKYIDAMYPNDSIPHHLLTELLKEEDEGLSLQICSELMEKIKNAS